MRGMVIHQVVAPTIQRRIDSLDGLRALAVLAILLSNIAYFAGPEWSKLLLDLAPGSAVDGWLESIHTAFVAGKPRSMLAILFGVGLYLQFAKRGQDRNLWPGGYLKRTLYLGLLGLLHFVFIWSGDILFFYAMVAFVACWMVRLETRKLLTVAGALMGLTALCCGVAGPLLAFIPMEVIGTDLYKSIDAEQAIFATGSYWDQLAYRVRFFGETLVAVPVYAIAMLPLFLVGIVLARSGVLAKPSAHPAIRNACLWGGLGVGLPLNLTALIGGPGGVNVGLVLVIEGVGGPMLGLGYLMLAAVAFEKGAPTIARLLTPVGRMALTTYISQSLICTFIFYSWGLALFDQLGRAQLILIVFGIWVVNIAVAHLWLRYFAMGPVEWAWRSATESQTLPILRGRELDEPPPQPEAPPVAAEVPRPPWQA
jgi:uncharacterized protein